MAPFVAIAVAAVALIAAWTDFRTRHIANWIPVSGVVLGFGLNTWSGGLHGAGISFAGLVAGVGLFITFFIVGGMGAGDVKLFGAIGSLVGPQRLLVVFVLTGLLGGIAAISLAIARGRLQDTLRRTAQLVSGSRPEATAASLRLPYGVVIAGATLVFLTAFR